MWVTIITPKGQVQDATENVAKPYVACRNRNKCDQRSSGLVHKSSFD